MPPDIARECLTGARRTRDEHSFLLGRYPEEKHGQALVKDIPVGRMGQPEDVGYMVAFLASELAGYISGQVFILDGGRTFK